MMLFSLGVKRGREGKSLYETRAASCTTRILQRWTPSSAEKRAVERVAFFAEDTHPGWIDSGDSDDTLTSSTVVSSGARRGAALVENLEGCVGPYSEQGDDIKASDASLRGGGALSLPDHSIIVNVTRGDTGRSCRFIFVLRPLSHFFFGAGGNSTIRKAYRDAVVRDLLERVCVEAALMPGRAWFFVFCGRNLQSEAGAESLMSALQSGSRQDIVLAVFCDLRKE